MGFLYTYWIIYIVATLLMWITTMDIETGRSPEWFIQIVQTCFGYGILFNMTVLLGGALS